MELFCQLRNVCLADIRKANEILNIKVSFIKNFHNICLGKVIFATFYFMFGIFVFVNQIYKFVNFVFYSWFGVQNI